MEAGPAGLGMAQFVHLRRITESVRPLAPDLAALGMGPLPAPLTHWALVKQLMGETRRDGEEERIHVDEVALVLACAHTPLSRPELCAAMLVRARFDKTMRHLRLRGLRGSLADGAVEDAAMLEHIEGGLHMEGGEGVTFGELLHVSEGPLLAWCATAARRPPTATHVSPSLSR